MSRLANDGDNAFACANSRVAMPITARFFFCSSAWRTKSATTDGATGFVPIDFHSAA